MELSHERKVEIVVGVATVLVMLAALVALGAMYGGESGALAYEGGWALVVLLILFVLGWAAVGIGLAYYLNDPPEPSSGDAVDGDPTTATDGGPDAGTADEDEDDPDGEA